MTHKWMVNDLLFNSAGVDKSKEEFCWTYVISAVTEQCNPGPVAAQNLPPNTISCWLNILAILRKCEKNITSDYISLHLIMQ